MFLTQKESDFICGRIDQDRRDVVVEPFSWPAYLKGGLDAKIWGFAALFMLSGTTSYAASYFLPLMYWPPLLNYLLCTYSNTEMQSPQLVRLLLRSITMPHCPTVRLRCIYYGPPRLDWR